MSITHVVGIDPGLVHTGVVRMVFDESTREIFVQSEAIVGPDATATAAWILGRPQPPREILVRLLIGGLMPHKFIEAYRPRSNFGTDQRMVEAVSNMRKATKGKVLNNTGVKKIIKPELMQLLGVWKFNTPTHHQDLRSAARILLLGMAKDEHLNRLLADIVRDHLNGITWEVRT